MSSSNQPLPTDIYPCILSCICHRPTIAALCRVDRTFRELGRKVLYEELWVKPWERGSDEKFRYLFRTLASYPLLSRLVKSLDVRFYPMAHGNLSEDVCIKAIRQMTSLESLSWTRDTTLTTSLLSIVSSLPNLKKLEINGHSAGSYDPTALCGLASTVTSNDRGGRSGLKDLRLILPDRGVAEVLVELVKGLSGSSDEVVEEVAVEGGETENVPKPSNQGLTGLEIISQDARFINDDLLVSLAPYLTNLRTFKLMGCGYAGPRGVFAVLRGAMNTLEDLALEGVNIPGDDEYLLDALLSFERESSLTRGIKLKALRSITGPTEVQHRLILPDYSRARAKTRGHVPFGTHQDDLFPAEHQEWFDYSQYPTLDMDSFLPPIMESLHISDRIEPDERGYSSLDKIKAAGKIWPGLKKLWFTGHYCDEVDLIALTDDRWGLKRLESLSIKVEVWDTDTLSFYFARLPNLRVLHLTTQDRAKSHSFFTMDRLQKIAAACGPQLEQIGWINRVYHVKRRMVIAEEGLETHVPVGWKLLSAGVAGAEEDADSGIDLGSLRLDIPSERRLAEQEREEVFLETWNMPAVVPEIFQVWRA